MLKTFPLAKQTLQNMTGSLKTQRYLCEVELPRNFRGEDFLRKLRKSEF